MIFVTVGTHEQPFNRLVEYMDHLVRDGIIKEEVVIQTGYSTYKPKYCTWSSLYPYDKMLELVNEARIVITHGGPSSFIMPLQIGKTPIVVPRQKKFNEHVNNHQLEFCKKIFENMKNIILITDEKELNYAILNYENENKVNYKMNNEEFNEKFELIVNKLFEG